MATKFYLRSTTHDTNRYKLDTTPGSSPTTRVVNTAAAVQVQWTNGAGGAAMEWCSEPLGAGATISGAVTFNIWAVESSMNANAGGRARLYKVSNDRATWTEMGGGPFDDQVEFSFSSSNVYNWTGTPTSNNVLAAGERIGVRLFLDDNCGSALATGYTATLTHDGGTGGSDGDTWIQTTETLTIATPQTVAGVAAGLTADMTDASVAATVTLAGASLSAALAVTAAGIEALAAFDPLAMLTRFYQRVRRGPHTRM